jgi:two-component system sensor histidine kinase YesM
MILFNKLLEENVKIRKDSLKSNLYFIFILSISIPTIILTIVIFFYMRSQYNSQLDRDIRNQLNSSSITISKILTNMRSANESSFISSQAFNALPLFINPSLEVDPLRLNQIRRNYEEIVYKNMFNIRQDIEAVSFFPYLKEGDDINSFIVSRTSEGVYTDREYDYYNQSWYKDIKDENSSEQVLYNKALPPYLSHFYVDDFPIISIVDEVQNLNTGKPLGIMRTDIRVSDLEKELGNIIVEDDTYIVVCQDKDIIATSSPLDSYAKYFLEENDNNLIHGYTKVSQDIPNTPFTLYYLKSKSDAIFALIFSIVLLIFAILMETEIGFSIFRRQSKEMIVSLNSIIETMNEYKKGNLEARAHGSRVKDIDKFSHSLNDMAIKLKNTIDNEYIAVIDRKTAQYNALQSQINPHFFYNTLNGFIALNRMGEQKKLEKSIISLTKLFRYTCADTDYVAFEEEFKFVREYLKLQKIKYEDRLLVNFDISDEAKIILVPRLILQPIVENAIIHGLEPVSRAVTISISANVFKTSYGDNLLIVVKDDGCGCSSEDLQINNSIALANIQSRIQIFSQGGILTSKSEKDKGVEIYISIPLEERVKKI